MGENVAPSGVPSLMIQREEERWRHFDNSVNAVSFGFVATAILISMFLVMAIFERFLRPRSTEGIQERGRRDAAAAASGDLEAAKVGLQSPNYRVYALRRQFRQYSLSAYKLIDLHSPLDPMSIYAKGVSVLMPGQDVPTFIAHPVPPPCPPERIAWPHHQHNPFHHSTLNS